MVYLAHHLIRIIRASDGEGMDDKEEEEGEEKNPSFSEITEGGYPPEWIPLIGFNAVLLFMITFLYYRTVIVHKKYSTKYPMQFFCTIGILTIYPFFVLMNLSGIIIPKSLVVVTFLAEAYEALSFVFFLRLVLHLMGGKKETRIVLKGQRVHLNVPPLCCLVCLPTIKFSRRYFIFNEFLIIQYVVAQLVLGFIDMMLGVDRSTSHPADLVEEDFSHITYGLLIFSLLLAIYGLSGIYHSAEEDLRKYNIFKKFICYKLLVTLAKIQSVAFASLVDAKVINNVAYGSFGDHLRVHLWSSTIIIMECVVVFPIAARFYGIGDYSTAGDYSAIRSDIVTFSVSNTGQADCDEGSSRLAVGERLQNHAGTDRYQNAALSEAAEGNEENGQVFKDDDNKIEMQPVKT